jgi:hypothetical protein
MVGSVTTLFSVVESVCAIADEAGDGVMRGRRADGSGHGLEEITVRRGEVHEDLARVGVHDVGEVR